MLVDALRAYLLPSMYDRFVPPQPLQSQQSDLGPNAKLLLRELDVVFKGQPLRYEVVVDKVEGAPREEIHRGIEEACVSGAVCQRGSGEAMRRHMIEGGGEDGVLSLVEGRGFIVLVGMI